MEVLRVEVLRDTLKAAAKMEAAKYAPKADAKVEVVKHAARHKAVPGLASVADSLASMTGVVLPSKAGPNPLVAEQRFARPPVMPTSALPQPMAVLASAAMRVQPFVAHEPTPAVLVLMLAGAHSLALRLP